MAPSLGPFLYAKDLQPACRLGIRDVWDDGCGWRAVLQPHPIANQEVHQRFEAGTDKDDP